MQGFLQKLSENKEMQKLRRTCCSDSLHSQHCLLFSVCSISLVASVLLSIYAKLSSHVLAFERASSSKHARNCVYLSKIENSSSLSELVTHSKPEHIEALV